MNSEHRRSAGKWLAAVLLGIATIGAYGTAYYSISALIPVIHDETGWSTGVLALAFSAATFGQGAVAIVTGRVLDRSGSRAAMLPTLLLGSALLLAASRAQSEWQFFAAWAAGGAAIAGGLYYNLTMPAISRLYPESKATALSILTLLGALASPIFYPIAGQLIDAWGWRGALQGLVLLMILCTLPAAILVQAPGASSPPTAPDREDRPSGAMKHVYLLFLVTAIIAMAGSSLLLSQVPAMQSAGLSLAAATSLAGLRGFFQIPGRLLMTPLLSRLGIRATVSLCYAGGAASAAFLAIACTGFQPDSAALVFCVLGGMSLGMLSPLNGLLQNDVFGDERLGTLSGFAVVIASIAAATGGAITGALIEVSGSYVPSLGLSGLLYAVAIVALWWQGRAQKSVARSQEPVEGMPVSAG